MELKSNKREVVTECRFTIELNLQTESEVLAYRNIFEAAQSYLMLHHKDPDNFKIEYELIKKLRDITRK